MSKQWTYVGDVNLEYGGVFYRIDPKGWDARGGYCDAVRVAPCSDAGAQDNAWWVETLTVLRPDDASSVLGSCGFEQTTNGHIVDSDGRLVASHGTPEHRLIVAEACQGYGNYDQDQSVCVQIGPDEDNRYRETVTPDIRLRANAKLENFVRRVMREC